MKLFLMMIIMSLIISFINHPISLGFSLILFTLIISWNLLFFNSSLWINYNLYLVMIGGILILFIYMTSISSNMKFFFKFYTLLTLSILIMFFCYTLSTNFIYLNSIFNMNNMLNNLSIHSNSMFYLITYLMIIFLFLMLFLIMNIIDYKMGPLRKF